MDSFFKFDFEAENGTPEISTPVYLKKHGGNSENTPCKAIWDTGATSSMISSAMAKKLQLQPHGTVQIAGVHGIQNARYYFVDMIFGNGFAIPAIKVSEAADFGGFDMLVGMDIIGRGIMSIDGTKEHLKVSFLYPAK